MKVFDYYAPNASVFFEGCASLMKKCVKCREPIEQKHKIEECSEGKKPQQVQLILPKPISSRVVTASATETVDLDSIPGGVKLKP